MAADRVELTSEQLAALTPTAPGTPITGANMPAGGVGLIGWLSAVWKVLFDVWDSVAHTLHTKADQGTAGTEPWLVSQTPKTSGGLSIYRSLSVIATGAVVKASAGQMYGYYIANVGSATRYIKLYNKATAPSEADTPVLTFPLPAGAAANVSHPNGVEFATGIGIRATTGVADNDTGAPTANDVVANVYFK